MLLGLSFQFAPLVITTTQPRTACYILGIRHTDNENKALTILIINFQKYIKD